MEKLIDKLAHSLRHFMECVLHSKELLEIDEAEAIGNMETSFESVINTFHSLKDISDKQKLKFNWYTKPETLILLLIRNARHHNLANNIRSVFSHKREANKKTKLLFVDFKSKENGSNTFDFYLCWKDIDTFIKLPKKESRIRSPQETKRIIYEYLDGNSLNNYQEQNGIDSECIYINIVPLLVNAMKELFPDFKDYVNPDLSTESYVFKHNFSTVKGFDCKNHKIKILN